MTSKGSSNSGRRRWFSLHSWVGLKFSLLFLFVGITGTFAVYAYEIDWLFTPALRAEAPPGAERQPLGTLIAAGINHQPDWTPRFLYANLPGYMAAELIAKDTNGDLQRIYINPYTGKVQGTADWFNIHRFLRQAHRHLMLPLTWGITIVGLLSIPLLLSIISAFPIFKRWWRGFFKTPRADALPRRWWGDLHRWLGLWSLPFILVIGVTGVWYLVERWGGDAPSSTSVFQPLPDASPLPRDAETLNNAIYRALEQWPEYRVDSVRFSGENQPLMLYGQDSALLVRPRSNAILFDPQTGEILAQIRGEELSAHQRIAEAADPLHFGTFGGHITRFLWFVFGVMLSLLSASGAWIYGMRVCGNSKTRRRHLKRENAQRSAGDPLPMKYRPSTRWKAIWHGQALGWVQFALIAACLILIGTAIWM